MIESRVDAKGWAREVASVSATLNEKRPRAARISQSKGQWRDHRDQMSKHSATLISFASSARRRLGELGEYSEATLSRVAKKERVLNSDTRFLGLAQEYVYPFARLPV